MSDGTNSREDLHTALDALLDAADAEGGRLDVPAFWTFVADVAHGRGITEDLHDGGVKEAQLAEDRLSPQGEHPPERQDRIRRAYNLAILRQLLFNLANPEARSVLPPAFAAMTLCGDVSAMLGGANGTGNGWPQLLYSAWKGNNYLAQAAQSRFVYAVMYEAGRRGRDPKSLLSEFGARNLRAGTWTHWVSEAPDADVALQAGKDNFNPARWTLSEADLAKVWELLTERNPRLKTPSDRLKK